MLSLKLITALLSVMLLGQMATAAFATEGGVTLPSHANEPIALNLNSADVKGDHVEYSELLQVYVGKSGACCTNRRPISGRYESDAVVVKFVPTFEFVEGQAYVVRVRQASESDKPVHTLTEFSIQSNVPSAPAQVTNIYPSGTLLPENILRFYIHFSQPMKPHVAHDYIKLLDASGNIDDAAFMRFKQELWSEDRKRLTLLMDPGRLKRNVSTNLRLGPAISKDENYTLVVESGWPAANGDGALKRYEKSFLALGALRKLPNVEYWTIKAPTIGTKSALEIRFDRPFDYQLLQTDLQVVSNSGADIPGEIIVEQNETALRFQPNDNWAEKQIYIIVDSELEDVAGNNFRDLLDHTIETGTKQIRSTSIAVELRL
jgi:hypothetical protein